MLTVRGFAGWSNSLTHQWSTGRTHAGHAQGGAVPREVVQKISARRRGKRVAPAGAGLHWSASSAMPAKPSTRSRIGVALAIALAVGTFVYALQSRHPEVLAYDWTFHWRAGRAVLDGLNPYLVVVPSGPYPFSYYWFYPLPSVFMALPTAPLPAVWSSAITVGATSGLLAFAISRENFSRLPIFLSAQFMMGAAAGSAPMILVTAAIAWPALQWLIVMKPNLGLAAFAARPTWRAIWGTAALCGVAFLLVPDWPVYWVRQVLSMKGGDTHRVLGHLSPIMVPGGVVLVLALLRWRRPEARMLFVMSLVPQTMTFHDVLPVMLVPQTFRQSLTLGLLSHGAFLLARSELISETDVGTMFHNTAPLALWLMYVPALILVLRRPNEGAIGSWLEGFTARLPRWVRGVPEAGDASQYVSS